MSYFEGAAIELKNGSHGVIKYRGKMRGKKGVWYGIKLTTSDGNTDGIDGGRYYFICKDKHGVFVKKKQIKCLLSSGRALLQSDKIEKLKKQNVSIFMSSTNIIKETDVEEKDDEKYSSSDYEITLTHMFLQSCLLYLLPYLNNETLNNLLNIEHFMTFYDMKLYFNSDILIERILYDASNNLMYGKIQKMGINIQIWNVQKALDNMKTIDNQLNAENKKAYPRKKKYFFLSLVALQHQFKNNNKYHEYYNKKLAKWSPRMAHKIDTKSYNSSTITKANCSKLNQDVVTYWWRLNEHAVRPDWEMDPNHVTTIFYNSNDHFGTARKFKSFEMILNDNKHININKTGLFAGRKNVKLLINQVKQLLIIKIMDLFVKKWIILNMKDWLSCRTTIVGWISPKYCIAIYGGY